MIDYSHACGDCSAMYARRTPSEEPPCDTCRIDPMPGNEDALRIWLPIRRQWRMGVNGPVDIDHLVIDAAMRREGVSGRECFGKILRLNQWYMERTKNAGE